jgi:hypothetical protein
MSGTARESTGIEASTNHLVPDMAKDDEIEDATDGLSTADAIGAPAECPETDATLLSLRCSFAPDEVPDEAGRPVTKLERTNSGDLELAKDNVPCRVRIVFWMIKIQRQRIYQIIYTLLLLATFMNVIRATGHRTNERHFFHVRGYDVPFWVWVFLGIDSVIFAAAAGRLVLRWGCAYIVDVVLWLVTIGGWMLVIQIDSEDMVSALLVPLVSLRTCWRLTLFSVQGLFEEFYGLDVQNIGQRRSLTIGEIEGSIAHVAAQQQETQDITGRTWRQRMSKVLADVIGVKERREQRHWEQYPQNKTNTGWGKARARMLTADMFRGSRELNKELETPEPVSTGSSQSWFKETQKPRKVRETRLSSVEFKDFVDGALGAITMNGDDDDDEVLTCALMEELQALRLMKNSSEGSYGITEVFASTWNHLEPQRFRVICMITSAAIGAGALPAYSIVTGKMVDAAQQAYDLVKEGRDNSDHLDDLRMHWVVLVIIFAISVVAQYFLANLAGRIIGACTANVQTKLVRQTTQASSMMSEERESSFNSVFAGDVQRVAALWSSLVWCAINPIVSILVALVTLCTLGLLGVRIASLYVAWALPIVMMPFLRERAVIKSAEFSKTSAILSSRYQNIVSVLPSVRASGNAKFVMEFAAGCIEDAMNKCDELLTSASLVQLWCLLFPCCSWLHAL